MPKAVFFIVGGWLWFDCYRFASEFYCAENKILAEYIILFVDELIVFCPLKWLYWRREAFVSHDFYLVVSK